MVKIKLYLLSMMLYLKQTLVETVLNATKPVHKLKNLSPILLFQYVKRSSIMNNSFFLEWKFCTLYFHF